jgi:hypothetical protein
MLLIRASVEGASVARDAQRPAGDDQHQRAHRVGGGDRHGRERRAADEQEPAAADPVTQRPHGDDEAGDQEAVAVGDPQLLGPAVCLVSMLTPHSVGHVAATGRSGWGGLDIRPGNPAEEYSGGGCQDGAARSDQLPRARQGLGDDEEEQQ